MQSVALILELSGPPCITEADKEIERSNRMNTAALYHRPESEFAFLYTRIPCVFGFRTAKGTLKQVFLLHGDTYTINEADWCTEPIPHEKGTCPQTFTIIDL